MSAIQTIGLYWDKIKTERRKKEEEAHIRINREMDELIHEFESQIVRAKNEGSKMSEIARAMGASRDTAYRYYRAGLEHTGIAGPAARFGIQSPYDKYFTADGDTIVINWPQWMNPDATDHEKRQRIWAPFNISGTVEHVGNRWHSLVKEPTENSREAYAAWDSMPEKILRKALGAQSFQNALNEWSGK